MAEIETEQEKTRAEIATYLREFADELDPNTEILDPQAENGGKVTIIAGNESATINPPESVSFGVEVDTESSLLEAGATRGASFTLQWDEEQVEETDDFEVE